MHFCVILPFLALSDERQAVTQWQNDLLHPLVTSYIVVECFDALRLLVTTVSLIHHMTIPQRVVSQNKATFPQYRQHHLVSLLVRSLVAVDEGHIELNAQLRRLRHSIANQELHPVAIRRALYPRRAQNSR